MLNSITMQTIGILFMYFTTNLIAQNMKPNVILIMADDLGFECVGANGGSSYSTPNIDELASNGMRFENCHAQPLCTPSRVQVMTGQYNVRNYTKFGELDRDQVTFGNLFKNAGYETAVAGKWQLGKEEDSPQHFGFDTSCLWQHMLPATDSAKHDTRYSNPLLEFNGKSRRFTNGEYSPDLACNFLCDFIEQNKDKPFFAYYPMNLTHCPFVPTPDSDDWNPNSMGSLTYKGEAGYFPDMVAYMDKLVGKIVSKVDELGLSKNTIIIFTGDNGTDKPIVSILRGRAYPGGKSETTDNGTHVPLIVSWKGAIEANKECHDLVDFSDILPTICEAAKIKITNQMALDGRSFFPQTLGKKGKKRKWIYTWYSRSGQTTHLKEYTRNKEYKLYTTGHLYNIKTDFFEKTPLKLKTIKGRDKKAYKTLKKGLDQYKGIRSIN